MQADGLTALGCAALRFHDGPPDAALGDDGHTQAIVARCHNDARIRGAELEVRKALANPQLRTELIIGRLQDQPGEFFAGQGNFGAH